MKIYLDVCCLSRPFDDQTQDRVRLESEAVKLVLELCVKGEHEWVVSEAVEDEALRNPDLDRRLAIWLLLHSVSPHLVVDDRSMALAQGFVAQGLGAMDALHLAVAEANGCDLLLTTDDSFLKRAKSLQPGLRVRVENPARWIVEVVEE